MRITELETAMKQQVAGMRALNMKYAFLKLRVHKCGISVTDNPSQIKNLLDLNKLEHLNQVLPLKEAAETRAHELNRENANLKFKCQLLDVENQQMKE